MRDIYRHSFDPWVGKILWRRKWQPTPVFLPGKYPGQRSLAGYSPWTTVLAGYSRKESDTTARTQTHTHTQSGKVNLKSNKQKLLELKVWQKIFNSKQMDSKDPGEHPPTLFTCKREARRDHFSLQELQMENSQQEAFLKDFTAQNKERDLVLNPQEKSWFWRFTTGYKLYLGNTFFMISVKYKTRGTFI